MALERTTAILRDEVDMLRKQIAMHVANGCRLMQFTTSAAAVAATTNLNGHTGHLNFMQ
jgi:hypothetical protein